MARLLRSNFDDGTGAIETHKVFISYNHQKPDLDYCNMLSNSDLFIHKEVELDEETGGVQRTRQRMFEEVRSDQLSDSTVTLLLVGKYTKTRSFIDHEIANSMIHGEKSKRSGILVIYLPSAEGYGLYKIRVAHVDRGEKLIYPNSINWVNVSNVREEVERMYPSMPLRIIDNLIKPEAKISVVPWGWIENDHKMLKKLIDLTFYDREKCEYEHNRPRMPIEIPTG